MDPSAVCRIKVAAYARDVKQQPPPTSAMNVG